MPLCFAHVLSSAWNVLRLLNLPPLGGIFLILSEAGQMLSLQCRPPHPPLSILCAGPANTSRFSLQGTPASCSCVLLAYELADSLREQRVSYLFLCPRCWHPVGVWKFGVEFIYITERFWEISQGLNFYQIWNKQEKRKHKFSKKKSLISTYVHSV